MPTPVSPLVAELDSVHPGHPLARPTHAGRAAPAATPTDQPVPDAGAIVAAGAAPAQPDRTADPQVRPTGRQRMAELPYGPFLTAALPALSRAFRVLNRIYVLPAIKAGLGPLHANPLTGSWMLLRTTGRRTGRPREVALGYALLDGHVYCSAGFGPGTAWYRNLLDQPRVEIVLPAGGFAGVAEPVTDPAELDRAWRALIRSLGVLGVAFVGRPDLPPAALAAATGNIPLVRIRTTGPAPGPADPGGLFWLVPTILGAAWLASRARRRRAGRAADGGASR